MSSPLRRFRTILASAAIVACAITSAVPSASADPVSARSDGTYSNPVVFADVPDPDVAFDGNAYYMVSTTMHEAPHVPIMRSTDLVNWTIVDYAGPILEDSDALALRNGESAYGEGSWAASIKVHDGTYFVSVASLTTGKTYVYTTTGIGTSPWTRSVLDGYLHDQSLLFDGDRAYLVHGGGAIEARPLALAADGTVSFAGPSVRLVDNASIGTPVGLRAEGAHAYKIGDHYYVFMVEWPANGIRQVVVWRSTQLTPQSEGGTWEGKVVFRERATVEGQQAGGVAQGGVVQASDGNWYSMVFQDLGPVGRAPHLAKVTWQDDWPVYQLDPVMPVPAGGGTSAVTDIVSSDEFDNGPTRANYWNTTNADDLTAELRDAYNGSNLSLQWQWNHNPDQRFWSLTERPGHLRLTTGSLATGVLDAKNTLSQRTFGPASSGAISLDVSGMRDGDVAGLSAFQRKYGFVGVTKAGGRTSIVMRRANAAGEVAFTSAPVPLDADRVFLKVDADYRRFANTATFAYSLDGTAWTRIGDSLAMEYTLPHFMGYRFGIVNYATETAGGHVDVDWFHAGDTVGEGLSQPCVGDAPVIDNGGLESGALTPWVGNDGATVALSSTERTTGAWGIGVTGRTTTGGGPGQSVAGELTAGQTYSVSARVKYTSGPATKQFNLTVLDSSYRGQVMANATATKGQWTTISGTYTVPADAYDLATTRIFLETPWTPTPDATNDLMDFFADDISVARDGSGAFDGGLVGNGGFEEASVDPWVGTEGAMLALDGSERASGNCSVVVTGRTATGSGAGQAFADKFVAGETYLVSAKVRYSSGPATKQFNFTTLDAAFKGEVMASAVATKGEWTTIAGEFTVPSTMDLATARVFVETPWTPTPDATDDLMDFRVDDVSIAPRSITPPTHPEGHAAPAKALGKSNPLMDYQYGADPWAMEYDGRVYVYMTSDASEVNASGDVVQTYEFDGDEDVKDNTYGRIQTLTILSSDDLVNWTNDGQVKVGGRFGAAPWANNSWAPAAAHKQIDGVDKFFLYFANSAGGIGVLTSDSPTGPWTDPVGGPLVSKATPGVSDVWWLFDPAVLVDDDGQGYLYFGGGVPETGGTSTAEQKNHPKTSRVMKLGDDMVSVVGTAQPIDAPAIFEDSGINKIGDTYYYSYCTNFDHDNVIDGHTIGYGNIAYMTSDSPMGPFTYQGEIMDNPGAFFGVGGNNHHSMVQFRGETYIAYHAQTLAKALVDGGSLDATHGYRSTGIDRVTVNADGSIAPITMTYDGVPQVKTLDPYAGIEAETIGWDSGIQDAYDPTSGIRVSPVGADTSGEQMLTNIHDGEWTALSDVDFGTDGATRVGARVKPKAGGTIEVRVDGPQSDPASRVVASIEVPAGDGTSWQAIESALDPAVTGTHDVFFSYAGDAEGELFDIDRFTFAAPVDDVAPVTTVALGPPAPTGAGGWYAGPVTVTLAATDSGSGVSGTRYALSDGVWHDYTGPVTIQDDGDHALSFQSTDLAGNTESVQSVRIPVDGTAPVVAATADGVDVVRVTLTATDATSGVATVSYRVGSGAWKPYSSAFDVPRVTTEQRVQYKAVDRAGNASVAGSLVVPASPTRLKPTETTLAVTPTRVAAGKVVKAVVRVRPASGTNGELISLYDGPDLVGTALLGSGGVAIVALPDLSVGVHVLTARYAGNGRFAESASPARTVTVDRSRSSVALRASAVTQTYGTRSPVRLVASVTLGSGKAAAGVVRFLDSGVVVATVPVVDGKAVLRLSQTLAVGRHHFTARFVPAGEEVVGSTSQPTTITVRRATATLTLRGGRPTLVSPGR